MNGNKINRTLSKCNHQKFFGIKKCALSYIKNKDINIDYLNIDSRYKSFDSDNQWIMGKVIGSNLVFSEVYMELSRTLELATSFWFLLFKFRSNTEDFELLFENCHVRDLGAS